MKDKTVVNTTKLILKFLEPHNKDKVGSLKLVDIEELARQIDTLYRQEIDDWKATVNAMSDPELVQALKAKYLKEGEDAV